MIRLRPLEPEDLEALYEIENDAFACSYTSNATPLSHYALREYIANQKSDIFADGQLRMAIIDNERPEEVLGLADLSDFSFIHSRAEVGIYVVGKYRHTGCATEALQQLINYAFGRLNIHELHAYVDEQNEASVKLFSKLNFEATASLKDWFLCGDNSLGKQSHRHNAVIFQLFSKKVI